MSVRSPVLIRLILLVLPLGLDTFAVSAALGMGGLPKSQRLRVSLLMSSFEMAMPVIGLLLGRALGQLVGSTADYTAIAVLILLGLWMLTHEEQDDEGKATQLPASTGVFLLAIGVSISLDELAMGFTIGLLHLPLWPAVVLIGAQAFLVAQLGLRVGSRANATLRDRAEQLAGLALLGLAALLAAEKLS